jgi:formylglycine-generating enzyme required for sulfatase activity
MYLLQRTILSFGLMLAAAQVTGETLTGLEFVEIPAGEFIMGTVNLEEAVADMPEPNKNRVADETPAHRVTFKQPFRLAKTEITQETWLRIMNSRPGPEQHWNHPQWKQLPVVSVSWHDTQRFINKLNQQSTNTVYRLPTEAEWEYAARAGNTALRPFSLLDMEQYAWYFHNSNDEIQPVATRKANPWGLHDMYGNVWEWLSDWYHPDTYKRSAVDNPQGPKEGDKKIRRGGSYHCQPHLIRSAYRSADLPDKAYSVLGFRLVATTR